MDIKVYENFPDQSPSEPNTADTRTEKSLLETNNCFLNKKSLFAKNSKSTQNNKCPRHPDEPLQFYCFNTTTLICGECLATGEYAGMEVMNIKRAAERVREKLKGQNTQSTTVETEDLYLVEKEMEGHEAQIEKTIANYKKEVKEKMDVLRSAIDAKEQEVLEKITRVHEGKLKAVKDVLTTFKGMKDNNGENGGKSPNKPNIENLSDLELCNYYTAKASELNRDKDEDITVKIQKAKRLVETQQSQDQLCFSKFEEEFKRVQNYIKSFNIDIGIRNTPVSFSSRIPTEEKPSKDTTITTNLNLLSKYSAYYVEEERKNRRKEHEDNNNCKVKGHTPRQTSAQKNSFLGKSTNTDSSPRTPLEKPSPRISYLGEKREGALLKRENSQKGFSNKYSSPMLNNYKEWFNQKVETVIGSTTPKASAREENSISINSFRSGLASNKALRDSFYLSRVSTGNKPVETSGKGMLETSIDQMGLCKTSPDMQGRDHMLSVSKIVSRNEGLGSLEFDNPFMSTSSKKGQSQVESLLTNENRLKEKLKKLNSQIFKV